ncbi:MAG: hypothetical protein FJ100_15775 [Deltaproteobacteria bacterium]|nr:hypothetical protein [Deltaproteobacteria bacterium]
MTAHPCPHCGAPNLSRLAPCRACGFDPVRAVTEAASLAAAEEPTQPVAATAADAGAADTRFARVVWWQRLAIELAGLNIVWFFVPDEACGDWSGLVSLALAVGLFAASMGLVAALSNLGQAVGCTLLTGALAYAFGGSVVGWVALLTSAYAGLAALRVFRRHGVTVGLLGPRLPAGHRCAPGRTRRALGWALTAAVIASIPGGHFWRQYERRAADATEPVTIQGMTFDKPVTWTVARSEGRDHIDSAEPRTSLAIQAVAADEAKAVPADLARGGAGLTCGAAQTELAGQVQWSRWLCSRPSQHGKVRAIVLLAVRPSGEGAVLIAVNREDEPISALHRTIAMARSLRFEAARAAAAGP